MPADDPNSDMEQFLPALGDPYDFLLLAVATLVIRLRNCCIAEVGFACARRGVHNQNLSQLTGESILSMRV
jgi:hypothetical protein